MRGAAALPFMRASFAYGSEAARDQETSPAAPPLSFLGPDGRAGRGLDAMTIFSQKRRGGGISRGNRSFFAGGMPFVALFGFVSTAVFSARSPLSLRPVKHPVSID